MNLALFDVDGTLLDSSGVHTAGMIHLLEKHFGIRIDRIDWGSFEHVTDTFVVSELFRRHLGREPETEEIHAYRESYVGLLDALRKERPGVFREIPGARAALRALSAQEDWAVALATGGSRKAALSKLRWAGFEVDHLPGGFAEDGLSRQEILTAAIASASTHHRIETFERIVSVGDGLWDLTTARQMNLEFVAIASGGNREQLEAAGAERCYEQFTETFHLELATPAR